MIDEKDKKDVKDIIVTNIEESLDNLTRKKYEFAKNPLTDEGMYISDEIMKTFDHYEVEISDYQRTRIKEDLVQLVNDSIVEIQEKIFDDLALESFEKDMLKNVKEFDELIFNGELSE